MKNQQGKNKTTNLIKKNIPNALTVLNLSMGFMAILVNDIMISPLLILVAAIADLFDGYFARILKAGSHFGKQLDSLADLVSFGIAPAFLYYHYFLIPGWPSMLAVTLLPVFSAIRLGIYNIDTRQKDNFRGMPTPANGLFFAFLVFAKPEHWFDVFDVWVFYFLIFLFAGLMVAPIIMLSLKNYEDKHHTEKMLIIVQVFMGAMILIYFRISGIPLMIINYIVASILWNIIKPKPSLFGFD